jgi:hypothetical protein
MPTLTADHRNALEMLADCGDEGCTLGIIQAHGFTPKLIAELVRGGLATASAEQMHAGGRPIDVTRVRITGAGRLVERR